MAVILDHKIHELSCFIKETIGLYFPEKKYNELAFKIKEISKETNVTDINELIDYLIKNSEDNKIIENLASKLTIGETYFWRDRELFKLLENNILPKLIEKKQKSSKTIRIWSAGCSSGEEPYSIAILLERLIPDIRKWNIIINATDINQEAIKKAISGNYSEWSFRSAPPWLKENYFTKIEKNNYKLDHSIRKRVNFSYLNFFKDEYPSLTNDTNALDIILCRNVFIYFEQEDIKKVSDKFYDCLTEEGILFTSASESYQYLSQRFKNNHFNNVSFYQKTQFETKIPPIAKSDINISEYRSKNKIKPEYKKIRRQTRRSETQLERQDLKSVKSFDYDDALKEYNDGNYQNAYNILQELKDIKDSSKIPLLIARIKANEGHLDEAGSLCDKIINEFKLVPETYFLKATILIELGKLEEAQVILQKSLFLNPEYIMPHFIMGNLAYNNEKYWDANKNFRNTLDLLEKLKDKDVIPDSDGITAARLKEIINTYLINGQ